MKVVINSCYGGFRLSNFAYKELLRRKGKECYFYEHKFNKGYYRIDNIEDTNKHLFIIVTTKDYGEFIEETEEIDAYHHDGDIRTDTDLIAMIEEFGSEKCSSKFSKLIIKDVPFGSYYRINEYDGYECIEYRDEIDWLTAE